MTENDDRRTPDERFDEIAKAAAGESSTGSDDVDGRERLRAILDAAVDGIITIDDRGRMESVNAAAERIFGYAAEELIGRNVSTLMPAPYRQQHDTYLANYLHTGVAKIIGVGREVVGQRKDGSTFPMDLAVGEVKLPGRRMFTGIIRDLTEVKRTEAELAEHRQSIRLMVENLPAGAVYVDTIHHTLLCNRAVEQMTGYSAADLATVESAFGCLFGDKAEQMARIYHDHPDANRTRSRTVEVTRADGATRLINVVRYRYDDHEIWLVRDETDERRSAEAIRQERDFATLLLSTTQAVITLVDENGRIVRSNPAADRLLSVPPGALTGREWEDAFSGSDVGSVGGCSPLPSLRDGKIVEALACSVTDRNDRSRQVLWWGSRLPETGPNGEWAMLVGHDATDIREAERRALQAERLAAIGQTMTGLAHESRNALQRARAGLDLLALDSDAGETATIDKIRTALSTLSRLYEEVRDYAATIQLVRKPVSPRLVWQKAWRTVSETSRSAVALDEIGDEPPVIDADAARLEQVFRNVFENAVAVSPEDSVVRVANESDGEAVRIMIDDDGPGLAGDQAERMFDAFFTTKQRGTGLGLAICRQLIEAHGGTIEAGNRDEGGCRVTVTLPRAS